MDKNETVGSISKLSKVKGFKLVHMNVRSLSKKIDQLRVLLTGSQLDVLTLSETWLDSAINSTTVLIEGFTVYRQDRGMVASTKKRGGGLLTLIKDKYASECEELPELSTVSRDVEALWTTIHREHCKDVVICNMYRPPSGKLDNFIKYLDECIGNLDLSKVEVFMMGDMNVNYKNKTSVEYKKLNFFIRSNGLSQLITSTTRNTDKTKSLLDLILTNSKYISLSGTLDHFISDHQPVFAVKKKRQGYQAES